MCVSTKGCDFSIVCAQNKNECMPRVYTLVPFLCESVEVCPSLCLSTLQGAFNRLDPTGQFRDRMLQSIPVGRMGEVEEHANLATYLLSDYSSWLSGATVVFDGGNLPFMAGMFNGLVKV